MTNFNVLVLDQASQVSGVTVININNCHTTWLYASVKTIKDKSLGKRLRLFEDFLTKMVIEHDIKVLVIEEVPFSKDGEKVKRALLKIQGICQLIADRYGLEVHIMDVNKWKRTAGITSRTRDAQKKESISLALRRFPKYKTLINLGDDLADCLNISIAWCIDMGYTK